MSTHMLSATAKHYMLTLPSRLYIVVPFHAQVLEIVKGFPLDEAVEKDQSYRSAYSQSCSMSECQYTSTPSTVVYQFSCMLVHSYTCTEFVVQQCMLTYCKPQTMNYMTHSRQGNILCTGHTLPVSVYMIHIYIYIYIASKEQMGEHTWLSYMLHPAPQTRIQ